MVVVGATFGGAFSLAASPGARCDCLQFATKFDALVSVISTVACQCVPESWKPVVETVASLTAGAVVPFLWGSVLCDQ